MPTFETIYAQHAHEYDQLVSREDYQNNLLAAIRSIAPLAGARVVELGAGTGRVTRLLAPEVRQIVACDRSPHMLGYAQRRLAELGVANAALAVAENRALPLPDACAEVAVAGWSFGHATEWDAGRWRAVIGESLDEMRRVLTPGGAAIIIETLGTGQEEPAPPSQVLADYYAWLEGERGWRRTWIRSDYRFRSQDEADRLTGFFFGSPSATIPAEGGQVIVPECTGIWWRSGGDA